MKIYVCVKQVPDTSGVVAVNPDGTMNRAKMPTIINPDDLNAMEEFARYLGLAFQIKDDILDVTGNEEELGKKVGMDATLEKSTFVSIYGLEQAEQMLSDYTQKAIETLSRYGEKAEFLEELANFLLSRNI